MIIRRERRTDFAAIKRVVAEAFKSEVEADLVDRIRESPQYRPDLSFVAVDGGEVVGHVMIDGCVVRNSQGERPIVMLSPLAVSPSRHGRGIGRSLIAVALGAAEHAGESLVVLEGDPAFYVKSGFVFAGDYGLSLPIPDWAPPEAAQVYLLRGYDPADSSLRGDVVYPAAFDGLG